MFSLFFPLKDLDEAITGAGREGPEGASGRTCAFVDRYERRRMSQLKCIALLTELLAERSIKDIQCAFCDVSRKMTMKDRSV